MKHILLPDKARVFAATEGASVTPAVTPPSTPGRRSSDPDITPPKSFSLPRSAYYIIFVEGCERFCYTGLKTILLLYFLQFIKLNKDSATAGYHIFSSLCYFAPTLGAIISDGYIGRYSTILILSIVYFVGTVALAVTAVPQIGRKELVGPAIALLMIAVGTGGIKPCVSAFGADQVSLSNTKQLNRYFAFFYFAVNLGSFISTIITPILRSDVHCFGYDCYSLAFGVPSALMFIAIIIFVIGTPLYKRIPPKENIIAKFLAVLWRGIRNAISKSKSNKKEHWLYYADDKYNEKDIEDVRSVLRIFVLFTPVPVYFALFNQIGSRWTYQASLMNGELGPFGTIQPDQMSSLNSLFVLLFIPMFEEVIYPLLTRCNCLIKPLQRMFCGMIIAIVAFLAATIVQQQIQSKATEMPIRAYSNVFNGYHCGIKIGSQDILGYGDTRKVSCETLLEVGVTFTSICDNGHFEYQLPKDGICPSMLVVWNINTNIDNENMNVTTLSNSIIGKKSIQNYAQLRMVSLENKQMRLTTSPNGYNFSIRGTLIPTEYQFVLPRNYRIEDPATERKSAETFRLSATAIYTILLFNGQDGKLYGKLFADAPPFTIHILWQVIQYALLTFSEILFGVTGLIFAYSQAPKRYKSVIMSGWLMTTAIGDLIVVIIAESRLVTNQALEFLFFAGLMAIATAIFGLLALKYNDNKPDNEDSEDQQLIIHKDFSEPENTTDISK